MSNDQEKALRELCTYNAESCDGFLTAAESVSDERVADAFRRVAADRKKHAEDLKAMLPEGADDAPDSLVTAQLHRWWIKARGSLQNGDAEAMLAEVDRGEDQISNAYEKHLEEGLGDTRLTELAREQQQRVLSQRAALAALAKTSVDEA